MGSSMFHTVCERFLRPMRRPARSPAGAPAAGRRGLPARVEVCPPATRRAPGGAADEPWRERLGGWIDAAWPGLLAATRQADASKKSTGRLPLAGVRREFSRNLGDIRSAPASAARNRIELARSLHELWHLRPEVFNLIAQHHDQAEAARRLARLNRHFPTRAPRSGFAALGATTSRGGRAE